MSRQDKMKIRAERKTTAEQRKAGRQVFKHLNMFCISAKICRIKKNAQRLRLCRFIVQLKHERKTYFKKFYFCYDTPVIFGHDTLLHCCCFFNLLGTIMAS